MWLGCIPASLMQVNSAAASSNWPLRQSWEIEEVHETTGSTGLFDCELKEIFGVWFLWEKEGWVGFWWDIKDFCVGNSDKIWVREGCVVAEKEVILDQDTRTILLTIKETSSWISWRFVRLNDGLHLTMRVQFLFATQKTVSYMKEFSWVIQ